VSETLLLTTKRVPPTVAHSAAQKLQASAATLKRVVRIFCNSFSPLQATWTPVGAGGLVFGWLYVGVVLGLENLVKGRFDRKWTMLD